MKKFLFIAAGLGLLALAAPALAQNTVVVSGDTCPVSNVLNVGNNRPLVLTQRGELCTEGAGGGGGSGTSSTYGAAFPADGTAAGFSDGTNMQGARVFDGDTGAGTQYIVGVELRASGSGGTTEVGTAAAPLRTDPTGTTTQPVSLAGVATAANQTAVQGTFGAQTANKSVIYDSTGTAVDWSATSNVTVATALPTGTNNIGDVDVASIAAGDNNIGNVDVVTLPALAAGTNNIGDVDVLTLPDVGALDAAAPSNGGLTACRYMASPTVMSEGDLVPAWCGTRGIIGVNLKIGDSVTDASMGASNADITTSASANRLGVNAVSFLVNGTAGERHNSVAGATSTGSGVAAVGVVPNSAAAGALTNSACTVACSNLVLKASAGNLYDAFCQSGTAGYCLVFNATSLPGDGTVTPAMCVPVAAGGSASFDLRDMPLRFSTGITVGYSTTGCFTLTASTTAFIRGSAQ